MHSLVIFTLICLIAINVNAFDYDRSFLIEIKSKINEQCYKDLVKADRNVRPFIIQAVSAWDAMTPGLINGAHDYTGNYEECIRSANNQIVMQYCVFDVGINYEGETPILCNASGRLRSRPCPSDDYITPNHILKWALCSVESCSEPNLIVIADVLLQKSDVGKAGLSYKPFLTQGACQVSTKSPFRTDTIIFIFLVSIIALTITICTFWHWSFSRKSAGLSVKAPTLVRNWSVIEQFSSLTKSPPSDIKIFHSLKSILMIFIVIFHGIMYSIMGPVANLEAIYQTVLQTRYWRAELAVETFFSMAAFVFTKNCFTSTSKISFKLVIKKYFCVIPVYALVIFYVSSFMEHTGHGPFWPYIMSIERDSCRKNWWLNLLMLGNYVPWENQCWTVSWTLPCDFHFFIVGIIMCNMVKKNKKLGMAVIFLFAVANLFYQVIYFMEDHTFLLRPHLDDSTRSYRTLGWFTEPYIRSHFRISSYLTGMLGGYIAFVCTEKKVTLSKRTSVICFLLSVSIMTLTFMSGLFYGEEIPGSNLKAGLYTTFMGPVGLSAFMLFTLTFVFGYVPKFSEFFNMKFWVPLSKLSFNVFLLHMVLVCRRVASRVQPIVNGDYIIILEILTDLGLTMVLALVMYLCVERPFYGMLQIMQAAYRGSAKPKLD